ncbi:SAM (S-ADENOSYL METHIONINE) TRANSPORTER [Salix koriyanagi]|uniref:SAM (S-ADENOSYL METHIONINE) TRANSPORTER n=1 Tax=Salix koriyanagi TaxID=2511006 RepID=A0A9Q0Q8T8_9ROSI|nr:SAM (S-ADENOSYL METHIONINE) TRANSPORTER [Salix koriyanagi]
MVYAVVQLSFMGVSLRCVGSGGLLQIGELGFVICVLAIDDLFLEVPSGEKGGGISFSGCIQLVGFCTFEACVGIFWPSIMKMRSQYIPEEARSTIMNFFRIPLNIFVCIVLYNYNCMDLLSVRPPSDLFIPFPLEVQCVPIIVMFGMCSIFLVVTSLLQKRLKVIAESQKRAQSGQQ